MLFSNSDAETFSNSFRSLIYKGKMNMFGLLNLGRPVLGIITWLLPIGILLRSNKQVHTNGIVFCKI